MPRGPKGEKRPADVIGAAAMVGRIATGEAEEKLCPDSPAAATGFPPRWRRASRISFCRCRTLQKWSMQRYQGRESAARTRSG